MKKKIIIISVSIFLIIGIGVTVFFVFLNKRKDESVDIESVDDESVDINPIDAEEFFKENGEIISIIDANDSTDVTTEKETVELFSVRGFTDYPITTNFSMDGSYFDEKEITSTSNDKHPMYSTYYTSTNNELWMIYVINGRVIAYPASYNMESGKDVEVVLAEKDSLFSYDNISNKFYETKPKESATVIVTIDLIDSKALDNLSKGDIDIQ